MRFYSFDDIRRAGNCAEFATAVYGSKIVAGRCAAVWRGGDNPEAVSIERDKWFDHVSKAGGGIIELAAFKFGGNIQAAQDFLGEYYHLTPKAQTGPAPSPDTRYHQLLRDGYREVARYEYRDAAGVLVHFVVRLQHPDKPGKEFVQGVPDTSRDGGVRWGLHGVETVLYRMDVVAASEWVAIVEGEKSADRMNAIGIPATTCCGGAKKWRAALSEPLRGKAVAIFPDNDPPGREHAQVVAASLYGVASSVRIVDPDPTLPPKAGIDDWLDHPAAGAHSADDIIARIAAATDWHPATDAAHAEEITEAMLRDAKAANSIPFRNYVPTEKETEKRGRKVKEITKEPRTHKAMLDDLWRRFLCFPRKTGDTILFDHDRDTGRIFEMHDADSLMAWIGRKSKSPVDWTRGDATVTQRQFFSSVMAEAMRYESISTIPSWPKRLDVYYSHPAIPPACPWQSRFNALLDMFRPATEYDKRLMAAMLCCPLWYIPGIPRPAWIIDSRDGQGSGKTTLVELVAQLYGNPPITVNKNQLENHMELVTKRCVSQKGRHRRVFLVDNATGNFSCDELSSMMTARDITGMAPYGRGEETRPNDLTYVITSNTATVGTDLSDRSLYIFVRKPGDTDGAMESWKVKVQNYIDEHRMEIVADIIAMLEKHRPFPGLRLRTRFKEFERDILQPCCGDAETTTQVLDYVFGARDESNIEHEQARAIRETFDHELDVLGLAGRPAFIRSEVVNAWGRRALNEANGPEYKGHPIQLVRNLAKAGFLPQIDKDVRRIERNGKRERHSGVSWNIPDSAENALLVYKDADGTIRSKLI
jgi:hypothetical protein